MSTKMESPKANALAHKVDSYIESQLAKTSRRIRWQDTVNLLLTFGILLAGYAVVMMGLDQAFHFATTVRLAGLIVFAVLVLGFLAGFLLPFLRKRVNPYYAAQQIEQTIPEAKESLINWLDLKDQPIPPAFRGALGTRAVQDLRQADLDEAVESRKPVWLGSILGVLVLGMAMLFLANPSHFTSYLGRMVNPLEEYAITAEMQITILEPTSKEHFVLLNTPVKIRARIEGEIPEYDGPNSPHLEFRHVQSGPFQRKALHQPGRGDWEATLAGDQIQHVVFYRISVGNFATPEYKIVARAAAQVLRCEVTLKYPEYLRLKPQTFEFAPNDPEAAKGIEGHEGTEVTLAIKTNRDIELGILDWHTEEQTQAIAGISPPDNPHSMEFPPLVLRKDGYFRLQFISKSGEKNIDRQEYPVKVVQDQAPRVQLVEPGRDVALPANGTLQLAGSATDDFGIQALRLQMRIFEDQKKPVLVSNPYRDGKGLQLLDKTYVRDVLYRELLALDKVQLPGQELKPLLVGTKIEYWLEAVDNCTFPPPKQGNVAESKHYWVSIESADGNQGKQDKIRQDAEASLKDHQSQQDQAIAKKNERIENQPEFKKEQFDEKVRQFLNSLDKNEPADQQPDPKKGGESQANSETKPEPQQKDSPGSGKDEGKSGEQEQSSAKGEPERKKDDSSSQAKDEGKGDQPNPADAKKEQGPPEAAGKDKGNSDPQENQADTKPGGGDDQQASAAKEGPDQNQTADTRGTPKEGPDSLNKQPGQSEPSSAKKPGTPDPSELQRIADLTREAQSPDPEKQKKALSELESLCKDSSNPGMCRAAQAALQQLNDGTGPGIPNSGANGNPNDPGGNSTANQAANNNEPGTNDKGANKNGQPSGNSSDGGSPGGTKTTKSGVAPGTTGTKASVPAAPGTKANKEFNELISSLQLQKVEDLDPDLLRKMPWSEKEKKDFLNQLRAHFEQKKAAKNQVVNPGSGSSAIGSIGPTELGNPNAKLINPALPGDGVTPPEYLQAYHKLKQVSQGK
jgi:hypothetical protein